MIRTLNFLEMTFAELSVAQATFSSSSVAPPKVFKTPLNCPGLALAGNSVFPEAEDMSSNSFTSPKEKFPPQIPSPLQGKNFLLCPAGCGALAKRDFQRNSTGDYKLLGTFLSSPWLKFYKKWLVAQPLMASTATPIMTLP